MNVRRALAIAGAEREPERSTQKTGAGERRYLAADNNPVHPREVGGRYRELDNAMVGKAPQELAQRPYR